MSEKYQVSNDVRIGSWNELNDWLFEGAWQEGLGRFRSNFVFRGMGDARLTLKTSLMQLGDSYDKLESHLLRNFRKYAYSYPSAGLGDSTWNWLALAQHHGLPTRLLDWTLSPYVAAHFATSELERFGVDGVIWCVNFLETNRLLPDVLKNMIDEEGAGTFTAEMLSQAADSLQKLDNLSQDDFVVFFEPPSLDDRIVNQMALFSLMSNPRGRLDEWLAEKSHLFRRIIIPASLKLEIRDKLDQVNVNERVLFPGLEGLSSWLRRHYSPKL